MDVTMDTVTDTAPETASAPPAHRTAVQTVGHWLNLARLWFRRFRRTRPFWGGVWSIVAGLWIIKMMDFGLVVAVSGGWSYSAGYILGGAMAVFGLVAWFAPLYKAISGIAVYLTALFAFIAANLGGFLIGTVLGIIGGSLIWSWGDKKPWDQTMLGKWQSRRQALEAADEPSEIGATEAAQ